MVIAIDGPAGSGKSTTARMVARELGFLYLDTGAMYRAVALAFMREDVEPTPSGARHVLAGLRIDLQHRDERLRVSLNGEDVTEEIRTPEVTTRVSEIAAIPEVREKLVDEQRRVARAYEEKGGVVLDGRDIGTVVFPKADVKIFMMADEMVRARRRFNEMCAHGLHATLEEVLSDIRIRDERDAGRAMSPLVKADDAIELDTSVMSIDEQVRTVIELIKERQNISTV